MIAFIYDHREAYGLKESKCIPTDANASISDFRFRAMPANVPLALIGVSRLSHPDFPIDSDLMAVKD